MILYDLCCRKDHRFESWFRNSKAVDKLIKAGAITCPVCGSTKVQKAPMAPRIAKSRDNSPQGGAGGTEEKSLVVKDGKPELAAVAEKAAEALAELRAAVEKNFENVGPRFSEEARRIHYGETRARGIYGDASAEEAQALRDEGIDVRTIPWKRRTNA